MKGGKIQDLLRISLNIRLARIMCYALLKDKHVITLTSITLIFSLFSFFCISIVLGIAIVVSLVCGLIAPVIIFSIFTGVVPKSHPKKEMVRSCSVCGGEECNRQHTTNAFNISAHAHVYFTVPQSIDEALEEIFNLVLDHHIYYWYKEISVHDQLADEIRYIIRYAAASLGTRLTKVDLPSIILDQLIPCGLVHVDSYVEGSRKVRGNSSLESSVIQYLKSKKALHVALQSREDEANYLRAVVDSLIPYLIPKQYQESSLAKCFLQELLGRFLILQGMDLLADPDIVNFLFLLLFDDESLPIPPDTPEPKVLLLKSFSSVNTHPRNSSMRSNLSSVLKDQNLLYLFHSFLKAEEAINILSFCLAVEDFNRHILDPELTTEQLQYLHKEALELYHTYMVPTAIDKLDFLPEIVSQIKEIVHGDVKDIVKLRTTRPLFQAYEYAYNLLEREYLPLFMNSNAYFSHICGLKHQQTFQRTSNRDAETVQSTSTGRGSLGKGVAQRVGIGLASLSRQMVFKPSVINGDEDVMATVDEGSDVYTVFLAEDGCTARNALEGLSHAFRDLSAWRVSIPRVEERIDSSGKMEFVFIVDVTRIDVSGDNPEELHWEVERRYNEFYVLETKLTEFHGDFPDNNLPPRRSFFASKGTSFMHSRRQIFEGFLQKLLQNPSLRNSQLLFLFFKSKDEFTASYLPDVSLSRLLKEVPRKLIKERGQNLDAFISSFISSTSYNSLKNVA
ncbi:Sorting nexin-14 [Armadillidium vulgare]|nr:Sorting nexin-14 [Armadillidium vulgare]